MFGFLSGRIGIDGTQSRFLRRVASSWKGNTEISLLDEYGCMASRLDC